MDWASLEALPLAQHLRLSRWTYPLVNAGHILGIAVLIGAVVPLDLRAFGIGSGLDSAVLIRHLRRFAVAGLILAASCGALLFAVSAGDYADNPWFRLKMTLLALALGNAAWHLRADPLPRRAALASLILWPGILLAGRMIAFS